MYKIVISTFLVFFATVTYAKDVTKCQLSFHAISKDKIIAEKPYLTHSDVVSINVRYDRPSGGNVMEIRFTEKGAKINEEYSEKNIGKTIAMFCDGELLSSPVIRGVVSNVVVINID